MSVILGCVLVPTARNPDKGLWFIFHHEEGGILAFDLTQEHPDVPYRHFESVLDGEDRKAPEDKIVLLGGPLESDKSMIVLHDTAHGHKNSHHINDDFSFLSYRYVVVPGKPPSVTNADDKPGRIDLGPSADFIVSIGFKLWEMDDLEDQLKNWQWTIVPATPDLIFRTSHEGRLKRAQLSIN